MNSFSYYIRFRGVYEFLDAASYDIFVEAKPRKRRISCLLTIPHLCQSMFLRYMDRTWIGHWPQVDYNECSLGKHRNVFATMYHKRFISHISHVYISVTCTYQSRVIKLPLSNSEHKWSNRIDKTLPMLY